MKNINNFYNLYRLLPMGLFLLGLSACTTSRPMVGETDGVYYNPKEDTEIVYSETIAEDNYYQNNSKEKRNLVRIGGKYFDKEGNTPYNNNYEDKSTYVEEYSNDYFNKKNDPYATWGDNRESVNVNFNYYGNPYYSGFGWGIGYSWGSPFYRDYGFSPYGYWNPYNRFHNYYGYGWGNPYNYWNPYWGNYYYGNPYWGYYGNPYYGGGGYYDPYVYYNGRNVQRAQRGKGMNSNVTINRGSSNSGSQRMERIRRGNNYGNSNRQLYNNRTNSYNSSSNRGYRSSPNSNYGTRSGQRIRRESSNRSSSSRSYSSPRSSSNWGSSSPSRGSSWSGSSSSSSSRSGQRIRR